MASKQTVKQCQMCADRENIARLYHTGRIQTQQAHDLLLSHGHISPLQASEDAMQGYVITQRILSAAESYI